MLRRCRVESKSTKDAFRKRRIKTLTFLPVHSAETRMLGFPWSFRIPPSEAGKPRPGRTLLLYVSGGKLVSKRGEKTYFATNPDSL